MRKLLLFLFVLFFTIQIFPEKIAEFKVLANPRCLFMDNQDIVIGDNFDILVFSKKDYKLKAKFGKKGEGPGEFMEPPALRLLPDGTIQAFSFNKFCIFSKEGKMLRDHRLEATIASMIQDIYEIKDKYILTRRLIIENKSALLTFTLADRKFNEIKEFYRTNYDISIPSATGFKYLKMINYLIEIEIYKNKVYIADAQKGFHFKIFNAEGELEYTIEKDFPKVKVDEDFKTKAAEYFKTTSRPQWERLRQYGLQFTFYENFPAIFSFRIADDKIYVITYKTKDNKHEFLILNLKGELEKRLFLPLKSLRFYEINAYNRFKPYLIENNQLYEIYEDEKTEIWELNRTDLSKIKEEE